MEEGKAVFHVEYVKDRVNAPEKAAGICGVPGFSTIVKTEALGAELEARP